MRQPASGCEVGGSGHDMHALASDLFPICRSITGDGVRETLNRLSALIPIDAVEVPSGTAVFDWTVPKVIALRSTTRSRLKRSVRTCSPSKNIRRGFRTELRIIAKIGDSA
jgi:aminopeptidase-like protein